MKQFTSEELNKMDKDVLITLVLSLQGQLDTISSQLRDLTEQVLLMNQRAFGRKSERSNPDTSDEYQLSLADFGYVFNEAEYLKDDSKEPSADEVIVSSYKRKGKSSGKRDTDLEGLPARVINHTLSEEELSKLFPKGYKELPEEVYKRLAIIPRIFIVDEHHVHVYASKSNDGTIVKANRPNDIFRNSLATPSLLSAITTGKYEAHQPLDRQSKAFANEGINLATNTMANWVINGAEQYLSIIYDELLNHLTGDSKLIHADETTVRVTKDGRAAGTKSYMWVYCNNPDIEKHPIIVYDYQKTRSTEHPREFLKDYSGVLVTDGYQAYHTLDKEKDDLTVAGCWVHAKRGFSEIIKALGKTGAEGSIAWEAENKISEIFHLDNKLNGLSKKAKEKERNLTVKPKVNAFFVWAKNIIGSMAAKGQTAKALQYCINQEQYLRVFLKNGDVPMDNNTAERAIRPFTVGRKNWTNIDTINGAKASAIIYSLVETCKANNIHVYKYLELLFTILPDHMDDTDRSFINDLLPWSKNVIKQCSAKKS